MADVDLDALIRKLAKQQHKSLMAAVKSRKDRYNALAAKAKDAGSKQRYRRLAKEALEIGTATVKRLQMSADNAAYSYARAIRQAVDAAATPKTPVKKAEAPANPPKKAVKNTKTAKKSRTAKKA
ncbi:MAG: hypothetical protein K2W78_03215 [Xanthobacteraceae bacterium]|nr:hypothetical protein [Xanthobacteraceae bacterium]